MKKILVEITSPAAGQTYDMFIPDSMQIGEISRLVGGLFTQVSNGTFCCTGLPLVSDKKTGMIYDLNKTVKESNIHNGAKILIY